MTHNERDTCVPANLSPDRMGLGYAIFEVSQGHLGELGFKPRGYYWDLTHVNLGELGFFQV